MDYSEKAAKVELEKLITWFEKLPNKLVAYRVLNTKSKTDINTNEIGSHFGMNKQMLLDSRGYVDNYQTNVYLVTAVIEKSQINIQETLSNRILYPHENEITVNNKGKNVLIKNIEKVELLFEEFFEDEF